MIKLRFALIFCVYLSALAVLATALTGCGIRPNKLTAPSNVSTESSKKKEDNFPSIYPKTSPTPAE